MDKTAQQPWSTKYVFIYISSRHLLELGRQMIQMKLGTTQGLELRVYTH